LKAANALNIKIVYSKLNSNYKVDPLDIAEKASKHTIAVIANIGSVEFGTVDDVKKIAKVCSEYEVPIHADAAFGGFILSIMGGGFSKMFPGFRCEKVYTIITDPHKTLFAPIPSGGFSLGSRTC